MFSWSTYGIQDKTRGPEIITISGPLLVRVARLELTTP